MNADRRPQAALADMTPAEPFIPRRAHETVLAALQHAGAQGARYYDLRVKLGGKSVEPVLVDLRDAGYRIVRCPGPRGEPRAVLIPRDVA